jgi:activating signal cointegrator 1
MSGEIRGLTLIQPWAGMVALGHKRIETRSWRNGYRGLVAIHAARGRADERLFAELCACAGYIASSAPPVVHVRGSVVAVARIADMITTRIAEAHGLASPCTLEWELGDFSAGRWAWLLEDVRPLDLPVPCRGLQGLWPLPHDVERAVRAGAGL